ncbi:polysaccharide lyase family protein [Clostridium sp. SHJSY1]|nr:polysaccharide lyase family protein [Clostridium sp. SHJSY1]
MKDVCLIINGMEAILDNGLIHIEINKRGSVSSLIKNGKELVSNLVGADGDVNKNRTFYLDYHANGKFRDFTPSELKVIKQKEDFVHIVYIDKTSLLYAEYHMIMKSNVSGLYSYVIVENNCKEKLTLSELRTVYRMGLKNFYMAYNVERIGRQPTHIELEKKIKLQDETYKYEDGEVYSKYDYAGYYKDNKLWGQYGDEFGAWFIPVSTEYYPSGPMKQELLIHYDGIILNYMTGAHFGTGAFDVPKEWKKLYGPWLFYINDGTEEEIINEAIKVADEQEKQWPYSWMEEKLYPIKRSIVKGKLVSSDGRVTDKSVVVLAKEGGEFLRQKGDYIFYGNADDNGNFEIHNVRPGKYTLYAYATHGTITRQLEKNNINVELSEMNLGDVIWEAPKYNNLLWQIGQSNRESSEFKFGNELRNYKWKTMLPSELEFKIGESKECDEWYYAQPKDSKWNIKFNLDKKFKGKIHLTVALAAATTYQIGLKNSPCLIIKVNDNVIKKAEYENDTTVYRSAVKSGRYHLEEIDFCGDLLHDGENVITFESIDGAFMYDTILLETDESGTCLTIDQMIKNYKMSGYISDKVYLELKKTLEKVNNIEEINLIEEIIQSIEFNCDVKEAIKTNIKTIKNK